MYYKIAHNEAVLLNSFGTAFFLATDESPKHDVISDTQLLLVLGYVKTA
jgi:hypothetical protein